MKNIYPILIFIAIAHSAGAQLSKSKKKKQDAAKDSVQAYVIVQKQLPSYDPFVLKMGVDSNNMAPVKIPNGYRAGSVEPLALPLEQIVPGKVKGLNIQNDPKQKKRKRK